MTSHRILSWLLLVALYFTSRFQAHPAFFQTNKPPISISI